MSEAAVPGIRGSIATVSEVVGGHDAKSPDCRQRSTLRSPECVFAITGVVDDFAVTAVGQVEAPREDFARVGASVVWIAIAPRPSGILTIAMVCAVTCVVPIVAALTFVMGLGRRTRTTSERQPVVIAIPIALVPIAVAWIAPVAVVAWFEVHDTSAGWT